MQHAEALDAVRNAVRGHFLEQGADVDFQLKEHILLRNDVYCGRRFLAEGLQAIWFVEEDQLKLHARDGTVAKVMSSAEAARCHTSEERRAA